MIYVFYFVLHETSYNWLSLVLKGVIIIMNMFIVSRETMFFIMYCIKTVFVSRETPVKQLQFKNICKFIGYKAYLY